MSKVRERSAGSKSGPAPNGRPAAGRKAVRQPAGKIGKKPPTNVPAVPVTVELDDVTAGYLAGDLAFILDDCKTAAESDRLDEVIKLASVVSRLALTLIAYRTAAKRAGKGGAR